MARAARRWSHARRLPFSLATPRTEPVRQVLVRNTPAVIELHDATLNLIELPAFRLNEGGDGLGCEVRLRAPRTFRERLETLLGIRVDANGQGCRHLCRLCELVYMLAGAAGSPMCVQDVCTSNSLW